jgi:ubiquinone/menaquinone biosynthesis C-methylase UbiE
LAQYSSAEAPVHYVQAVDGTAPESKCLRSRLQLLQDLLADHPPGDMLDAGCGPGVLTKAMLTSHGDAFRITVLDQSLSMIKYCRTTASEVGAVGPAVGQLEALPFDAASFDITVVTGALEYANAAAAIKEIARVVRPGGLVIVTMLNPRSPYRLAEWFLYWPLLRTLAVIERLVGVPRDRRHGMAITGIRTLSERRLARLMAQAGLRPDKVVHYDFSALIPPLDRLPLLARRAERAIRRREAGHALPSWLATGYLITATRESGTGASRRIGGKLCTAADTAAPR